MLSLARLQRKLRLLESPYRTPQTLVGGPRLDAALMAVSGRTVNHQGHGQGLDAASAPGADGGSTQGAGRLAADLGRAQWAADRTGKRKLRPVAAGSDFMELSIWSAAKEKAGNVIFADVHDRHGHKLLSIRDMNTFDTSLRKKRLMTLAHLFLIHRYKTTHGSLPEPDGGQPAPGAEDAAAGHLRQGQYRSGPDHRGGGEPSAHQRTAQPR